MENGNLRLQATPLENPGPVQRATSTPPPPIGGPASGSRSFGYVIAGVVCVAMC